MSNIPRSHPRYISLMTRERISKGMKKGLVHETGLIAHGRGEAFDYLIGEETQGFAEEAEKAAAACLLNAEKPVISVNGNVVALVPDEIVDLSKCVSAKIEVNLFHRTKKRMNLLIDELKEHGATKVYGEKADGVIPGLEHDRGLCDKDGIFSSDVILVPLEDGDRCQALKKMGKKVIAIDLNPLSRTAKTADVTIVDNVIRAVPNIQKWVEKLRKEEQKTLEDIENSWDNKKNLKESLFFISNRFK
jgi:4-phosphopantoate---beta-alanine ligase